jgi:ATP-dependent exoDNAse (exonuclease V) beta subunit
MENKVSQLEFPEVVVVEASAGSGKTYALAKRFLQLLINPRLKSDYVPLRSILAITFTNKAAIEMKRRILDLLKKLAFGVFSSEDEEKDILETLGVSKELARKKAYLVMDEIIRNYNFFQVKTIDSFINTLLLGFALNIDRSASFKIKRDYIWYLSYSLDILIDLAQKDEKVHSFFKKFLQHYLLIERNQGWFPKKNILKLIRSLFELSNKYGSFFMVYKADIEELMQKKRILFNYIKDLLDRLPSGFNGRAKNSIKKFVENKDIVFDLIDLPTWFNETIPMNKGYSAPTELVKRWEDIYTLIKEIAETEARVWFNPYITFFHKVIENFQLLSRKEDILFLDELNHKARLLFSKEGLTVAEVYYRFATRFSHYLIDEFQDTSILQWKNLYLMIEEALSSGGSLFYVGDKKQAIYRFRGGEAQLFDEIKETFRYYKIKETRLSKNRRSHKAIVEFNNEIFSQDNLRMSLIKMGVAEEVAPKEEVILKVFEDAKQEYMKDKPWGYVYIERIEESNQEERNILIKDKVLSLIDELKKRSFSYNDIAILCRDNEEVELVTTWLLESHLPTESEKTLNVKENPLIKEIISFLRFLDSPIDDLSFAAFIMGEIFRSATGLSYKEIESFIFNLNKEKEHKLALYHFFRLKYPLIWDKFVDEFFKKVGFISPYELIVSIYKKFNIIENFYDEQAFFMKLLELAKIKEEEYVSLGEFISYIENTLPEDLYVTVAQTDYIRVLTIHKSKGLEFGVVILPFLRMDVIPETRRGTSCYMVGDQQQLSLVKITKPHRKYSSYLNEIYKEAYIKACIDELNNIYVGFTRAKYELYVFIPQKSGAKINKAKYLIPEHIKERGEKRIYSQEERKEIKDVSLIVELPISTYRDWIEFLKDEFADKEKVKVRNQIIQGNIIHYVLSRIGNLYEVNFDEVLKEAIQNAKKAFPFIKDFTYIEKKVKKLIEKDEIKPFFYIPEGKVYQEKEVVDFYGNTRRIDRLIIKEKEVWVVDYKSSGGYEEEYRQQIHEYVKIIQRIYPNFKVRGFIIYLDELNIEEIKAE